MSQRATRFLEQALDPVANFDAGYKAGRASVLPQSSFPASPFGGSLIQDLERTVESAEEGNGKLRILPEPEPPTKPNERPWIKLVDLGSAPMRCNSTDCPRSAKLLLESRDQEVLPYCTACALVEFALWMAGV
jgi:hypothetical protein